MTKYVDDSNGCWEAKLCKFVKLYPKFNRAINIIHDAWLERLEHDITVQKRKDEIMWNNIEIFNELGGFSKDPNLEPIEPITNL